MLAAAIQDGLMLKQPEGWKAGAKVHEGKQGSRVSRDSRGSLAGVSQGSRGSLAGVSQGSRRGLAGVSQGSRRGLAGVSQGSRRGLARVSQRSRRGRAGRKQKKLGGSWGEGWGEAGGKLGGEQKKRDFWGRKGEKEERRVGHSGFGRAAFVTHCRASVPRRLRRRLPTAACSRSGRGSL